MTQKRRSFSPQQKAGIVRHHLVNTVPVSQLADEFQVQPTLIHNWSKTALTQLERAFETAAKPKQPDQREQTIAKLQEKLASKNEVISELMEENIRSKKV